MNAPVGYDKKMNRVSTSIRQVGLVHERRVQLHDLGETLVVRRLPLQPIELPVPSQGSCNVRQIHARSCVASVLVG